MDTQSRRKMCVAGQFYDAEPAKLRKLFEQYASDVSSHIPENRRVISMIAPHAGYMFSGKTAFDTYYQAKSSDYEKIALLTPAHYVGFSGISLPDYNLCETPFGDITVDSKSINKLTSEVFIHNSKPHIKEHSLEVHLPFIKYFFPDSEVIPLVCGQLNGAMVDTASKELMNLYDDKTLWIISSDFTHYGRSFGYLPFNSDVKNNLNKLDGGAIEKILDFDERGFSEYLGRTEATICGASPIRLILSMLSSKRGAKSSIASKLIKYTTSGALTGDYTHCVSYAGIVFFE